MWEKASAFHCGATMIAGYRHRPGNHCGSTALRNLLAFDGVEIWERKGEKEEELGGPRKIQGGAYVFGLKKKKHTENISRCRQVLMQ